MAYINQDPEWKTMTADIIIVADSDPQPTGLLDVNGNKLFRIKDTIPFGFQGKNNGSHC